jgi:hypothetical protein
MSFEFILDLDCPVKQAIPTEALVGLVKARDQANAVLAMARREGDRRPPSEIRITRRLQTPAGVEDCSVSIQEMLDDSAKLGPLEAHCEGCKANVRGKPFGCYGTVAYPIRSRTEDWLMGLLPGSPGSTAGTMLLKAIKDLGYDGRPIARLRPQATFFERKAPARRQWGSLFSRRQVTSDQVLQMLFCVGSLQPTHSLMCALFLGLIPHDLAPSDFESALLDRPTRLRLLNESRMPEDVGDGQIWDMIVFLDALVRSAAFDLPLATSY